jgi:hypothetical protein
MQYSVVNYKTVKENIDFRYEPEFFLPKYIEQENILLNRNTIPLADCVVFSNGRAFDSNNFSFEGDIYISKIGDVTQKRDYKSWEKVPKKHFEELNAKYLKHNDILMTLTGDPPDVGKVQLVFNPPKETLSWNQRVALLRLKKQDSITSPEFLFVALSSKYCREHIERWAKGIRQRNVGNPAVLDMAIPVFSKIQNPLAEIVKKSFNFLEQSKNLYSQAEEFLLSELGLLNWRPKHELAFVKNFSKAKQADRFDAEYFQPKYEEIVEAVKKYKGGFDKLGNLVKIKDKNFTPKDNEQYKYIELANISSNGEINGYVENFGSVLPSRARRKVQKGDVIISSIEGSLESIALITESWTNALCSTGFFVVNSDKINSGTLLVLLKTRVGQMQLKKGCKGTILTAIGKDKFSKIVFPKIDPEIQKVIKEKIVEMYSTKSLSKSLIEIAKSGVEIAIEKSEEEAGKWINNELEKLDIKII